MKKVYISLLVFVLIMTNVCFAMPPEFSGGINNEYEYEETVFVSGEPIKLIGEIDVTEKDKGTQKTVSYKFKLENKEKQATLDRKIDYIVDMDKRNDKGQTIENTSINKFSESIKVGNDKYDLEDFQFSKSDVVDNRPASDFFSGNIKGRKYYKVNKDQGEVIIDLTGADVGYENFWGSTSTYILDFAISSKRKLSEKDTVTWNGSVRINTSDSMNKVLKYAENEASLSSFNGGHMRITSEEMVSSYEYDLPKFASDNKVEKNKRNTGTARASRSMSPKIERLIVPKFRDLGGHWAQDYIEKLYSLDVFDEIGNFFSPDVPMTRIDFTKAVIKACDIRTSLDNPKPVRTSSKKVKEESIYTDMDVSDKNYAYVKSSSEKGIITGQNSMFKPNDSLTRAQAVTILIRALGFENKAPSPGYYTSFSDDNSIPYWAKDSVYMGREIGLLQGDSANRANPNTVMTRAESSAMIVRFLEFLQKDLQKDYRENIIHFN